MFFQLLPLQLQRMTYIAVYTPVGVIAAKVLWNSEIQLEEWRWFVDDVAGMTFIPIICGSRY